MIKITGLITEYNPFHSGHLYHLNHSRRITGADYCVALMSGSFVQRGAPAVYDKYVRAKMALLEGVDLVLEMPAAFSTASAREFASYGVALFSALGADSICFGSECGDIDALKNAAALLDRETEEISYELKEKLKSGMTYPQARSSVYAPLLPDADILTKPNNILAIEYCRAAARFHSAAKLFTIRREGSGYHDVSSPEHVLASAAAVRKMLKDGSDPAALKRMVPPRAASIIKEEIPVFPDDFSSLLNYRIWEGNYDGIADLPPDLAGRLYNLALSPCSFEERIQSLKSRQITYTRASRALLHLLLNIKTCDMEEYKNAGLAPCARILGFRKEAAPLLSELKKRTSVPIVTKLSDAPRILPETALKLLTQEIESAHLYQIVKQKKGCAFKNEYTQPLVII